MSSWLREQLTFWLNSEFYAVGLSSFAGSAIRLALVNYFQQVVVSDTKRSYGPFMQLVVAQPYLVPNFLGCFIMAACIANMQQLSGTVSVPFYKFLTTGLCGCITTFSSWINDGLDKEFGRTDWFRYLIMIMMEFWMTWSAFTLGYAAVKIVEASPLLRGFFSCAVCMRDTAVDISKRNPLSISVDMGSEMMKKRFTFASKKSSKKENALQEEHGDEEEAEEERADSEQHTPSDKKRVAFEDPKSDSDVELNADITDDEARLNLISGRISMWREDGTKTEAKTIREPIFLNFFKKNEFTIWCSLFWLTAIPIWIVLIRLSQFNFYNNRIRRDTYRSIALAPLGAWVRWGLTRFPKLKALWPEMNPQTMLANLIGVIFMCILTVYSSSTWVSAINDGFSGCCSTVSTFFAEIHTLYFEKGPLVGFRYATATFFLAIASGTKYF